MTHPEFRSLGKSQATIRDHNEQAAARLRALIAQGLESGPGRPLTESVITELRTQSLADDA